VTERRSAVDHPRSDDTKGRDRHDGEAEGGVSGLVGTGDADDVQAQGAAPNAPGGGVPSPPGDGG
jgi:hypothetical protein